MSGQMTFVPIKSTKVDAKGRFYLPGSVVDNLFPNVPADEREVDVYLGPGGRVMLVPITREQ